MLISFVSKQRRETFIKRAHWGIAAEAMQAGSVNREYNRTQYTVVQSWPIWRGPITHWEVCWQSALHTASGRTSILGNSIHRLQRQSYTHAERANWAGWKDCYLLKRCGVWSSVLSVDRWNTVQNQEGQTENLQGKWMVVSTSAWISDSARSTKSRHGTWLRPALVPWGISFLTWENVRNWKKIWADHLIYWRACSLGYRYTTTHLPPYSTLAK